MDHDPSRSILSLLKSWPSVGVILTIVSTPVKSALTQSRLRGSPDCAKDTLLIGIKRRQNKQRLKKREYTFFIKNLLIRNERCVASFFVLTVLTYVVPDNAVLSGVRPGILVNHRYMVPRPRLRHRLPTVAINRILRSDSALKDFCNSHKASGTL